MRYAPCVVDRPSHDLVHSGTCFALVNRPQNLVNQSDLEAWITACIDPVRIHAATLDTELELPMGPTFDRYCGRCQYLPMRGWKFFAHRIHVDLRRQASALCTA